MRVVAAGTRRQRHGASNPAAETRKEGMWRKERPGRNTAEETLMEGALRQELTEGAWRQAHGDSGMAAWIGWQEYCHRNTEAMAQWLRHGGMDAAGRILWQGSGGIVTVARTLWQGGTGDRNTAYQGACL